MVLSQSGILEGPKFKLFNFLGFKLADNFCGRTDNEAVGGCFELGCEQGAGTNHAAGGNFNVIQENAAHADQAIIADFAAVEDGAVADGHIIAELQRGIQADVEDGVILNIGVAADRHFVHIGAQDGVEPDGGMIFESDSAADDGPFCEEDIFAYDGFALEELFKGMAHEVGGMVCRFGKITGGFMRE